MRVGEMLRQARKEKKISLRSAEEQTKIKISYLEAMENDDFKLLPGRIYAIGFIRSYAKFLGLNSEEIVNIYKKDNPETEESNQLQETITEKPGKNNKFIYYSIVIGGLLLLLSFGFIYQFNQDEEKDNQVPVTSPSSEQVNSDNQEQAKEQETVEIEQPDINESVEEEIAVDYTGVEVVVQIDNDPCWIEVRVDGTIEFSATVQPGYKETFIGDSQIDITFGNAGAATIIYNGEDQGTIGEKGQVVTKSYQAAE